MNTNDNYSESDAIFYILFIEWHFMSMLLNRTQTDNA